MKVSNLYFGSVFSIHPSRILLDKRDSISNFQYDKITVLYCSSTNYGYAKDVLSGIKYQIGYQDLNPNKKYQFVCNFQPLDFVLKQENYHKKNISRKKLIKILLDQEIIKEI